MIAPGSLVRFRFVAPADMTEDEVEAMGEALRATGADADVEVSDRFIGLGEVTVLLAVVVTLAEAAKAVLDLVDRIKGKVGYTLDTRERPAVLTSNPNLPAGVGLVILPDGRTETIDKRNPSALDALRGLLKLVAV